jgi:hypothetical protein
MNPLPTEFTYPTVLFSQEGAFFTPPDVFHPRILGRDFFPYTVTSELGRHLASYLQYYLASRSTPFQSFLVKFVFEKFFFFQDYVLPYLWIYFPWATFIFNYPIGIFHIQFFYYFPFFFYVVCIFFLFFLFFSSIFYTNRSRFDYFIMLTILSYFFVGFSLFLFFSFSTFLFGIVFFFIFYTICTPFFIRFSNKVFFKFSHYFSYKSTVILSLPPPPSSSFSSSEFFFNRSFNDENFKEKMESSNISRTTFNDSYDKNKVFIPLSKISKVSYKTRDKQFTKYPFFNFKLNDWKIWIKRKIIYSNYYSFSSLRFKKGLNDIRQVFPFEGPSVYDERIPDYDKPLPRIPDFYEELEPTLEDDIELDYGPEFETSNDEFIPEENHDEWEHLSIPHFIIPKFRNSKVSYFNFTSSDIDIDLRPKLSDWIQNEIGRIWSLKQWLRILNPKHSDKPLSYVLIQNETFYTSSSFSNHYIYKLSVFYFFILESIFNFFFPPWILRVFSKDITRKTFFLILNDLSKFERSFFIIPSHFSNILRVLFSLETFFINNSKNLSFCDKLYYFSTVSSLLIFFKNNIKIGFHSYFLSKCVIHQLLRMLGSTKKNINL